MKINLRAESEDCVNKSLQGRENPKTGRQRDPSLGGRHEDVDKVRGEETFMQRASRMKRKRQKLAKAGEREREEEEEVWEERHAKVGGLEKEQV